MIEHELGKGGLKVSAVGLGCMGMRERLTPEELAQIDAVLPAGAASGARYHAQAMQAIDR
jgi:aryl-alcohol dehydrogenase-like predicted oxidoreductase